MSPIMTSLGSGGCGLLPTAYSSPAAPHEPVPFCLLPTAYCSPPAPSPYCSTTIIA